MESIIEKMREDVKRYRLAGATAELTSLQTFIGDCDTASKKGIVIDDARVIRDIKLAIKANEMVINNCKDGDARITKLGRENDFLYKYIPIIEQLTDDQIGTIIAENPFSSLKEGMDFFRANYTGKYDGGKLSKLLRETL